MDKRSITSKINGALGGRPKKYEELYYLEGELWKLVERNTDYMISSKGRVITLKKKGQLMKTNVSNTGYPSVMMSFGKRELKNKFGIHRLMAEAFLEKRDEHTEVDHIDGNKLNHDLNNLRWVTSLENRRGAMVKKAKTSSKYRGVSFCKKSNKWKARLTFNHKTYCIGSFDCEHEAAKAYNEKAIELGFMPEALNKIKENNENIS